MTNRITLYRACKELGISYQTIYGNVNYMGKLEFQYGDPYTVDSDKVAEVKQLMDSGLDLRKAMERMG